MGCMILLLPNGDVLSKASRTAPWRFSRLFEASLSGAERAKPTFGLFSQLNRSSFYAAENNEHNKPTFVAQFVPAKHGDFAVRISPPLPPNMDRIVALSPSGRLLLVGRYEKHLGIFYRLLHQTEGGWRVLLSGLQFRGGRFDKNEEPYLKAMFDQSERFLLLRKGFRLLVNSSYAVTSVYQIGTTGLKHLQNFDLAPDWSTVYGIKSGWFLTDTSGDTGPETYRLTVGSTANHVQKTRYGAGVAVGPPVGRDIALLQRVEHPTGAMPVKLRNRTVGSVSPNDQIYEEPTLYFWPNVGAAWINPQKQGLEINGDLIKIPSRFITADTTVYNTHLFFVPDEAALLL